MHCTEGPQLAEHTHRVVPVRSGITVQCVAVTSFTNKEAHDSKHPPKNLRKAIYKLIG